MQDAYFQEKGDVGNWIQIGYSAPGTGNSFSYESTVFKYSTTASTVEATTADWMATPKSDLNDCPANAVGWKLTATKSTTDDKAFTISKTGTTALCEALTASWANLTRD